MSTRRRQANVAWALLAIPGWGLLGCAQEAEPELARTAQELEVCASGPTTSGIDVSKWQGGIDWPAVKASGIEFAFIRVSDGASYLDPDFDVNWAGAGDAGLLRGAYQFFRPAQDAIAQADLLLETMGPLGPYDLPPVIDVEVTGSQPASVIATKVGQWLDHVEAAVGKTPIVYTGLYFWEDNVASDDFVDRPLWIAQYGRDCPTLPAPWTNWAFWQTSASGAVPGIYGDVDTDLFQGSLADLLAFAAGQTVCGDGACSWGETAQSCAADCPVCAPIPGDGRIVDETDLCFTAGGPPAYIRSEAAGWAGSLEWTYTTASAQEVSFGLWSLAFAERGRYRVEAYTAAPFAESKQATYFVTHAGTLTAAEVDQTAADGWALVGDFDFAAGAQQSVRLSDNTGEPNAGQTRLVFDALRFTRLDLPAVDGGLEEVDGGAGGDAGVDPPGDPDCGCHVARRQSGRGALLPLLGVLLLLRLRCRSVRTSRAGRSSKNPLRSAPPRGATTQPQSSPPGSVTGPQTAGSSASG